MFVVQTSAVRTVDVVANSEISASSDPVSVVSRFFAIPLREVYAVLWRVGVLDIED
ncbi:Rv1535 domain-containing protein [Mycobacterium sp. smrl_JER01]|uniref:Rv1535 domain-containing protein n=1 Tax=Mycobacterium sp. smrl_JER01 TaxID=3402633 RepID=UPI003AC0B62A